MAQYVDDEYGTFYENYGDLQARYELEDRFANLSDRQWNTLENYTYEEQKCMLEFWSDPYPEGPHCNSSWDGFQCWPTSPANTTVYLECPSTVQGMVYNYSGLSDDIRGYRYCNSSGVWQHGSWSNYSACLIPLMIQLSKFRHINDTQPAIDWERYDNALLLVDIYFFGGILSTLFLIITLFIFTYFKTLQCNRISIHKNLVISFIARYVVMIVMFEPFVSKRESSYREVAWLCKLLSSMLQYCTIANIFWMFVEGLFLHNRVAVSVFSTEAPFRIFYIVGWGLPGLIVLNWATCMTVYNHNKCWNGYFQMPYMYIILVPIGIALIVNGIFLCNIIRILITKLRANNTMEADQVRKAVKATAVLFPLLGMSNVLFFYIPATASGGESEMAYRITNAVCQSSQGILVSVIYCFLNSEVRAAVYKKWQRYKVQRLGAANRGRRRSSRTSSLFLSTTENSHNSMHRYRCSSNHNSTPAAAPLAPLNAANHSTV